MKNVFKAMVAADDGAAALNSNESTVAIDMTNAEKATLGAVGTFGGGMLTWMISLDGTNFVSSGLTQSAPGKVDLAIPCKLVKGTLAGATTPSVSCAMAMRTLDQ